jgi:hypothetical protein
MQLLEKRLALGDVRCFYISKSQAEDTVNVFDETAVARFGDDAQVFDEQPSLGSLRGVWPKKIFLRLL